MTAEKYIIEVSRKRAQELFETQLVDTKISKIIARSASTPTTSGQWHITTNPKDRLPNTSFYTTLKFVNN